MLISCPACDTKFSVNPAQIGHKGRRLRCAKCAHTWVQRLVDIPRVAAEPEAPADPSAAAPAGQNFAGMLEQNLASDTDTAAAPLVSDTSPALPRWRYFMVLAWRLVGGRLTPSVIWLLYAVLWVGLLSVAITQRATVVAAWPPAAKLYLTFGIPVPTVGYGFKIGDVEVSYVPRGIETAVNFTATLTNVLDEPRHVPPLRAELLGSGGEVMGELSIPPSEPVLAGNSSMTITGTFATLPPAVQRLQVAVASPYLLTTAD